MHTHEELKYQIALNLTEHLGSITAKRLIQQFGSAREVFAQKPRDLMSTLGIGSTRARSILSSETVSIAEKQLAFAEKRNIKVISFMDDAYSKRLRQCEDAPIVIFVQGDQDLNASKFIGVVGTRRPTPYGLDICRQIVEALVPHKAVIVSGLAYGVDIVAHRTALRNQLKTIAVLAHGLDNIYPTSHFADAMEISSSGALITEFPIGTSPDRENFPKRNRIAAGLCDAVVVVESDLTGGSMITANLANSYSRDVLAVPGRIGDKMSTGCLNLIKTNRAAILEQPGDIEVLLGWDQKPRKSQQTQLFVEMNPEESLIAEWLRKTGRAGIDDLCIGVEMPMSKVALHLLTLELKGAVRALPGKVFEVVG